MESLRLNLQMCKIHSCIHCVPCSPVSGVTGVILLVSPVQGGVVTSEVLPGSVVVIVHDVDPVVDLSYSRNIIPNLPRVMLLQRPDGRRLSKAFLRLLTAA